MEHQMKEGKSSNKWHRSSTELPEFATPYCCKRCGILLTKYDKSGMTFKRGNFQLHLWGDVHAAMVCYGRHCSTQNVISINTNDNSLGGIDM